MKIERESVAVQRRYRLPARKGEARAYQRRMAWYNPHNEAIC